MQISDYIPFNIIKCLSFLDLTHFRGQGRNPSNNFVAFLENLRHHIFVLRLSDLYQVSVYWAHERFILLFNAIIFTYLIFLKGTYLQMSCILPENKIKEIFFLKRKFYFSKPSLNSAICVTRSGTVMPQGHHHL